MTAGVAEAQWAPRAAARTLAGVSDDSSARKGTATTAFGVSRRESHDASSFYARFTPPVISDDDTVNAVDDLGDGCIHGDARDMHHLPDDSVALVVRT